MNRTSNIYVKVILTISFIFAVFFTACVPSGYITGESIFMTPEPDTLNIVPKTTPASEINIPLTTPVPLVTEGESSVHYSSDYEYYIENGEAVISGYFGYCGAEIPAELGGYPVTKIDDRAFYNTSISCDSIPDSVTYIGDSAFSYCLNVKKLTFSNGLIYIGSNAFSQCAFLSEVILPDTVTSIGDHAFSECASLASVRLSSQLSSMGKGVFSNCTFLERVEIPNGVMCIGEEAFEQCWSLSNIDLPASVRDIGRNAFPTYSRLINISISISEQNKFFKIEDDVLFSKDGTILIKYPYNESRTKYDIPDTVVKIKAGAFANSGLIKVVIPASTEEIEAGAFRNISQIEIDSNNENYRVKDGMIFSYDWKLLHTVFRKDNLETYNIPKSVTTIGEEAFNGAYDLKSVSIPQGVTSIGNEAFRGCKKLNNLKIPDGVSIIGNNAFSGCESMAKITLPESIVSIGDEAFSGCTALSDITLPGVLENAGEGLFLNCESLENIKLPENTDKISNNMFSGCKSLTSIDLPSNIIEIGDGAFFACDLLASVNLPPDLLKIGDNAFSCCTSLVQIELPESITEIGEGAFSNCYFLKTITLPPNITEIARNTFHGCASLEDISIPEGVKILGNNSISECRFLKEIHLPDSLCSIGAEAFRGCKLITDITIPGQVASIGVYAFQYCDELAVPVSITDGVSSICERSFWGCNALSNLLLPDSIKTIENEAFYYCDQLRNLQLPSGVEYIAEHVFNNPNIMLKAASGTYAEQYILELGNRIDSDAFDLNEESLLRQIIVPYSLATDPIWLPHEYNEDLTEFGFHVLEFNANGKYQVLFCDCTYSKKEKTVYFRNIFDNNLFMTANDEELDYLFGCFMCGYQPKNNNYTLVSEKYFGQELEILNFESIESAFPNWPWKSEISRTEWACFCLIVGGNLQIGEWDWALSEKQMENTTIKDLARQYIDNYPLDALILLPSTNQT